MQNNPLVSIIIPTYNRAHLIGETLDSVMVQNYANWECIVVDDGSDDNTAEVVEKFVTKDSRFRFYTRSQSHMNGGNGARNYGFKMSQGDYIIWFDSDDLMTKNHVFAKVERILSGQKSLDFVVGKTLNFNGNAFQEPYQYNIPSYGFRAEDFILRKTHWYTCDTMLSRSLANQIGYHEQMKFWQDYYYHCLMLLKSTNGSFIDEILTHRRVHNSSIQKNNTANELKFNLALLEAKILTYEDIKHTISRSVRRVYLNGLINIAFYIALKKKITKYCWYLIKEVRDNLGIKAVLFFLFALSFGFVFKKGEYFLNKAKLKKF
jgi:glycosyltransferase involved in cell wall biosynthesis